MKGGLNMDDYCTCGASCAATGFEDDFGYWYVCTFCNKKIEGEHHYYNHYDGEDHDDIELD